MQEINFEILNYFWLPNKYYRASVSGVNAYTIKRIDNNIHSDNDRKYFETYVLPRLRKNIKPYPESEKYLPKSQMYPEGFRDIVNDALKELYSNRQSYVYSKEQLIEVLRFIPDINVSYRDDIYFIKRQIEVGVTK